ncbi:MFS transporter [Chryseobacterium sp. Ch-15]|uniref:MFS transporter n=1 Tax=Chryseobacterium muglaense TaxID=2893752 RepID=A0A9Q3UQ08_9FLAO|nr:MFS transporter [Chryseobacterium muglaense]MCC9033343.1 MFS transporter [Chryseobacterium muglaense]MCM2553838.1 MFS transporter [Chryseobacterium muglaense]
MNSKNRGTGIKKIAYTGCLGVIGIISTEFGIIGVLPQVASHYSIEIDKAGLLLSAFALTIFLIGPFLVLLTSGINRKKMMLLAISLFLVSNIASAFAPPFWLLVLLRILPAILQPVFFSAAVGTIIRTAPKQEQHKLMGIVIGGIALAQVTVIPLSTYMSSIYGWQMSFIIQGIITLIALAGIFIFIPNIPVKEKLTYGSQLQILKKPRFLISIVFNVFLISAWFSTYSYFADYLGKVKMMTGQEISYMLLLFGIAGVVANWLAGRLLSRNIVLTTAFFLLGTILLPLILQFTGTNFYVQTVVVCFWGIMYGPAFLTAISYMIDAAPEAPEFANSLQSSFGNLGVSAGTIVGGWFIANMGIDSIPWVGAGFGTLAILTMMSREIIDKQTKLKTEDHVAELELCSKK